MSCQTSQLDPNAKKQRITTSHSYYQAGTSERRRKRQRPRHQTTSLFSIPPPSLSIFIVLLCLVSVECAEQHGSCFQQLRSSDFERDGVITKLEFADAVAEISHGAFGSDFSKLPLTLKETFESLSKRRPCRSPSIDCINLDAPPEYLEEVVCPNIRTAINSALTQQQQQQLKQRFTAQDQTPTGPSPLVPKQLDGGAPLDCNGTIDRLQCDRALIISDLSRDSLVDEDEYIRFINRLSGNEYLGVNFNDLPGNIIATYNKFATTGSQIDINGSQPGQNPTVDQENFLTALCCETDLAVKNPGQPISNPPVEASPSPPPGSLPPTFLPTSCNIAMASSDFDRDNFMSEEEYIRFLNRLTRNEFQDLDFNDLDSRLQDNFNNLADGSNGKINIYGSKGGQSANDAEAEHLENVCVGTAVALSPAPPSEPTTPAPVAPVVPTAPVVQPSLSPTFSDSMCRTAIASSDFNRDDRMDENEYLRFLNRLTRNEFASQTFATLETPLPQTFDKLKDEDGQINIFGAKPGQNGSEEQEAFVVEICLEVAIALDNLGGTLAPIPSSPSKTPTTLSPGVIPTPPVAEPSLPPTFLNTMCVNFMAASDTSRDDRMNEEEYVTFLNRLTRNEFRDKNFTSLEAPLIQAFVKLKDEVDGQINIYGAKPGQDAGEEQEAFLTDICLEVAIALDRLGESVVPTKSPSSSSGTAPNAPTGAPQPTAPTLSSGVAEVSNSFIVSNLVGLDASQLQSGFNREGLDNAYGLFAKQAVLQLESMKRKLQSPSPSLRKRKLAVSFLEGSDAVYLLLDSACPESILSANSSLPGNSGLSGNLSLSDNESGILCQTAFANFRVTIDTENATAINALYTAETQELIAQGLLQDVLTTNSPETLLSVANASFPVSSTLPPTLTPPTKPPATAPSISEVYNSFILSNAAGLVASQLQSGVNREGLENAYDIFAETSITKHIDMSLEQRNLHSSVSPLQTRKLAVTFTKNSAGIYLIFDSECPESVPKSEVCQTAFANFRVTFDKDPQDISDILTAETQAFIADGLLQDILTEEDPKTPLKVVNASWPVSSTFPPTLAPNNSTNPPTDAPSPKDDGKKEKSGAGAAAGGAIVGIILVIGGGFLARKYFASRGGREGKSGDIGNTTDVENVDNIDNDSDEEENENEINQGKDESEEAVNRFSFDQGISNKSDIYIENSQQDSSDAGENEITFGGLEGGGAFGETAEESGGSDAENDFDFGGKDTKETNDTFGGGADFGSGKFFDNSTGPGTWGASNPSGDSGETDFFGGGTGFTPKESGSNAVQTEGAADAIGATGVFDDGGGFGSQGFGDTDADDGEGSFKSQHSGSQGSRSYYSDEDRSRGSRSYYSDEERSRGSRSYYSGDDRSRGSRSQISGEESRSYYSGDDQSRGSRSHYSGSQGSRSQISGSQGGRSHHSGSQASRSHYSGSQGSRSQISGSQGGRSHHSGSRGSRSHYSGSRGSRSQYSGDDRSQGSRSHYSGEEGSRGSQGSRSHYSGDDRSRGSRSYYSGEERSRGSRSYYSGEEGSIPLSPPGSQGSRSYYSGDDRSQGSRSYYSGDDRSQGSRISYSGDDQGSRSYHSGDDRSEGSRSSYSGDDRGPQSHSSYSSYE